MTIQFPIASFFIIGLLLLLTIFLLFYIARRDKLIRERNKALSVTYRMYEILLESLVFEEMVQKVANIIPQYLGYEYGVLALIDKENQLLKKYAISNLQENEMPREENNTPFDQLEIPLDEEKNLCIQVMRENKQQISYNLFDLLRPNVSFDETLKDQNLYNIKTNIVTPISLKNEITGILIISTSKPYNKINKYELEIISKFAEGIGVTLRASGLYTDLKTRTDELRKTNFKLRQADRVKDEFISITSHELKTPMSIIKSYLWMMQSGKGGKVTKKQSEYIDKAMQGADRMISLISDILNISRMEQGRLEFTFEYIDLAKLITSIMDEFKFKISEKGLELNLELNKNLPPIYSDKNKVIEIIMNLVNNATKYTDNGSITIKLEMVTANFVRFSVTDTGRGISKDESNMLFKKFQRLDNSYETVAKAGGTGLGLYIVKMYIGNLGGSIGVESEGLGKGSTFWITLPTNSDLTKKGGQFARL